ncbi:MAG: hypothetical protein ABID54_01325 [Pseudomonadota bacterium]
MTEEDTNRRLDRIEKLLQQIVDLMLDDDDGDEEEDSLGFLEKPKLIDRERFII